MIYLLTPRQIPHNTRSINQLSQRNSNQEIIQIKVKNRN